MEFQVPITATGESPIWLPGWMTDMSEYRRFFYELAHGEGEIILRQVGVPHHYDLVSGDDLASQDYIQITR